MKYRINQQWNCYYISKQSLIKYIYKVEMKRCFYEILEVDKKATPRLYRKLALKFHPDKNQAENAKQRFVQINQAYNVLSDVNERTWYDNNREKILFNKEQMSKQDLEQYSFGFNIWEYFTTSCFKGYDDSQGAFYQVYRNVFEKIKAEQTKAFNQREDLEEEQKKYEGFGDSHTSQDKVLQFYQDWQNFTTYKTFIWIQQWDTRDAGSRWVRRQMQKQNKKQRQGEKKTFLKTIKDLLAYVKKRDPRFMEYLMKLKQEDEKKEKQRIEKQKEKKKQKEEMKIIKQKLQQQRFKQIQEYYKKQNQQATQGKKTTAKVEVDEEDFEKEFYCHVCEKQFKSENQFNNHQKSKQHKQMIKQIEKEVLLKEEIAQKIEYPSEKENPKQVNIKQQQNQSPKKNKKKKKKKNQAQQQKGESEQEAQQKIEQPVKVEIKKQQVTKKQDKKVLVKQSSSDDEDAFMNTLLNNRNKKAETKPEVQQTASQLKQDKKKKAAKVKIQQSEESQQEKQETRLGKAKLKKQKKAEQQKVKPAENKCNVCSQKFASKTKLFQHINKTGHASTK